MAEILQQQFDLVYYGHFTDQGVDAMSVREREFHYRRLVQKKDEENAAVEKARKGKR